MKIFTLAKKITALILVLVVATVFIPATATQNNDSVEYYARYNPYEQFMSKAVNAPKDARSTVDYSGIDFYVSGSYYEATLAPMDSTWRDKSKNDLYISELSATDTNGHHNNCNFLCSESYGNSVGSRLATSQSGGMIKLAFTAPESGIYKVVPLEVTGAGGKSMLLTSPQSYSGMKPEYFTQTFKIMHGQTMLFSKTLTLNNYADVTADIADDISVTLAKGETLDFYFESNEFWGRTNLYTNFEIWLTEYSSDSVSEVYFKNSNYIIGMDEVVNISPVIVPPTANNQKVTYTVDNESILSVKEDGTVEPKKAGYTTVRVKTEDGGFEAETVVAIYDKDAPVYKIKDLYDAAVEKIGDVSATTTVDNDIKTAWQALYFNGTDYAPSEKVTREQWNNSFGIKFHSSKVNYNGAGVSQYYSSGEFFSTLFYGRQDAEIKGAAYQFTAPKYGIYSLTSDVNNISLAASTVNYMNADANAKTKDLVVNFYLNDSKIHTTTLNINNTSVPFPTINSLEMNEGDTLRIELVTEIWEKGQVVLFPKMIQVLSEKPTVPTTGITLSDLQVSLTKGGTHALITTVLPLTASDKEVVYASSDKTVATVSADGVITAVAPGTAVITAKCKNFDFSAECGVTVTAEKLNFIKSLWQPTLDKIEKEKVLTEYTTDCQFISGALADGVYTDFEYAMNLGWGNPRAVIYTSDTNEKGSSTSKQSVNISDGYAIIGSYNADSWVYAGYKADADGMYTLSPSDACKNISLALASYCTLEDIVKWGEDLPFYVRITKNGKTIWPQNNPKGIELIPSKTSSVAIPTLKNLKLYKGDVIRLEVLGQSKIPSRHVTVKFDFDMQMDSSVAVDVPVKSVSISDSRCELSKGVSYQLSANVLPSNASNKNIKWVSSDVSVVKVNSTGKVTTVNQGNAIVYAVSEENGEIKAQCNVTVTSFEVIKYTPDELKASLDAKLGDRVIVNAEAIDLDTNWSAQFKVSDSDDWETLSALTTYDWKNTGSPASYSFKYANRTAVGLESVSGYHTPYVSTTDVQAAMVFTADRSGTYTITPDLRNASIYIPGTYVNGHIVAADKTKEYKFSILVNDKEVYSVKISAANSSAAFPTIENIFLNAKDTIRFVITDNKESSSPIYAYFSPVISLVKPDPVDHAPSAENCEYILEPDKVFTVKLKAIHPNGRAIKFDVLDSNPKASLKIDEKGIMTYTPSKGYKGIDVRRIKLSDSIGKSSVVTVTFMVANRYDAVEILSALFMKADPDLSDNGGVALSYGDSVWKYQYTYDGLSYANGSPKYYDTDTISVIVNGGWWGYNTYSEKMPQACICEVNGVAAIKVMAGHSPWGKNAVGGVTFIAPNSGTYLLRANELFDSISIAADLSNELFKNPMNVWISKNGKKIWPEDESSAELSRENLEVSFPELKVAMQKGDTLRVCISGNDYNERQNLMAVAPTVFDIGAYDARFDPNTEKEGGTVITDDDGEPMVRYDGFSMKAEKILALKGNYSQPVVKDGYTVDKIKSLEQTAPFELSISYEECENAAGYTVIVYRKTDDGYELFSQVDSDKITATVTGLEAGEYAVQVSAVDKFGQYVEIYTSKDFSVDASGNIEFKNPVSILLIVIIAAAVVLVLGAAVTAVIIIRKRKSGVKL